MPANSVIRIRSGDTVQVRTGVLRGIGPQGPPGPVGPMGLTGPQGVQGKTGELGNLYARLYSSSQVTTSQTWAQLSYNVASNEILTIVDTYQFKFKEAGTYLVASSTMFDERIVGGVSAGGRGVRLFDITANAAVTTVMAEAVDNGPTVVNNADQVIVADPLHVYRMEAFSEDSTGINASTRTLTLLRIGTGPAGPPGPQGPVGIQGSQGPVGPVGNATGGFTNHDSIMPTDQNGNTTKLPSEGDPGGTNKTTTDQALPYPDGTQRPANPWFFKTLAQALEKKIVSRFTTAADRTSKRATQLAGEMSVLLDSGRVDIANYTGAATTLAGINATALMQSPVAQIRWVSAAPDPTKYYPPGTIFLKTT